MSTRKGTTWREVEAAIENYRRCCADCDGYAIADGPMEAMRTAYDNLKRTIRAYAKAQARKALTRRGR